MLSKTKQLFHIFSKASCSYSSPYYGFSGKTIYNYSQKRNLNPKDKMKLQSFHNEKKKKSTQYTYMQIGLYGFIFACCFAAIPLYRVFCEHVGLVGNYDKKTYEFDEKKVVNLKKYNVKFLGHPQPGINWQFEPIEKQVYVGASQTAIVFYRLRNKEDFPIVGFSTYNINPEEVNIYFSKIQCFCFNQQMINPKEELMLPLFFYLQPEINEDPDVGRIHEITVNYQFYRSNKQDLAKFAAEELQKVQENKKKLNTIRAKKKNMSLEEYEDYLIFGDEKQEQEKKPQQIVVTAQKAA